MYGIRGMLLKLKNDSNTNYCVEGFGERYDTPDVDVSKKNDTATTQKVPVVADPPSNAEAGPSTNTQAEPELAPHPGVENIDISAVSQDEQSSTQDNETLPELDPELLLALGEEIGNQVGSDDSVTRLMKGIYKSRPSLPKYNSTWDPQIVLNHIANWYPNRELSREMLTKKLVMLLALCTAHRMQTFSLVKIENISFHSNGINIAIKDIIKTSAAGREQPTLFIPYFEENPRICPAKTLEDYLHVTHADRPDNVPHLLLTVKRPYKGATAQTLSRWTKQVLEASGVDVTKFSAHSARHAATSAAYTAGISVDAIRKTAGWSNASQTFAKYYNRPIIGPNNFARSVCQIDD
ncbi:phage integrase family domain-containing protein [Phthorimaea operculella]|nr:phage integrase family domain-containing protein [Phthorimaea operculella]